jgi:hypothetical protein
MPPHGVEKVNKEQVKVESSLPKIIKSGTQLQIYVNVEFYGAFAPLCSTVVLYSTAPFDESTITWNNRPAPQEKLAEYKSIISSTWYSFSSPELEEYVESVKNTGGIAAFMLEIKDRNRGICDLAWKFSTKESGYIPRLIHNSKIYYSVGDAWVSDGPPIGPNVNTGSEIKMNVCSCSTGVQGGTQISYVQFSLKPASIEEEESERKSSFIFESHPNPFSSSTCISYLVESNNKKVILKVYNTAGKLVRTLVNETQDIGKYQIVWDGTNDKGNELPSGYYFYRLKIGKVLFTAKTLKLRF